MVFERKSIPIVAAYWASKLSYMKRVINEVLPTDCSPRKTSLNFRRGFENEVSVMVLNVCMQVTGFQIEEIEYA